MTILQAIILGIVQGLTEFLPVSSSAHLVIVPFLAGWKFPADQAFIFDVLVQLGTLLAVIIYFWRDLWAIIRAFVLGIARGKPFADPNARLGWLIILATIPAGLLGVTIKDTVEAAFGSVSATAAFLFVTALLLVCAELFGKRQRSYEQLNWKDALAMGVAQAISIFPGISRSGSTITGGMLRGLDRPAAARFSFLMSIPIMLAAGALAGKDMIGMPNVVSFLPVVAAGFIAAAIVGYLSIHWLLRFLVKRSLYLFAVYCAAAGLITLLIANAR